MLPYHEKVVKLMREANPKIVTCCQLAHGGMKAEEQYRININDASEQTLQEIVEAFGNAAIRAERAGYDSVQIHSAHTYLLS